MNKDNLVIDNGFLVRRSPLRFNTDRLALDSSRFSRDEEEPEDTIEVHNYIPNYSRGNEESEARSFDDETDDEPDDQPEDGEEVARFPVHGYTVQTEGDHHVVYRGIPRTKSDAHSFDARPGRARDASRAGPPRTLADLNRFHHAHYARKNPR